MKRARSVAALIARNAETCLLIATAVERVDAEGRGLLDRVRDHMAGTLKAQSYDGGRSGSGTHGDPVGAAVMAIADQGDRAALDLDRLGVLARQIDTAGDEMVRILRAYQPRQASGSARHETAPDPGCESCARVEASKGVPWWTEPRTDVPTDVSGALEVKRLLCRWCIDHVRQTGQLPSKAELGQHRDGTRIICKHERLKA